MQPIKVNKLPILILVFSVCCCLLWSSTSQAAELEDSYLSYKGRGEAGQGVFDLQSDDLLKAFKNIMPGDQVSQKLFIKNDSSKGTKIKLNVVSTDALDMAFLEQLTLTLMNGNQQLFEGDIQQMTADNGIELGTFSEGQEQGYTLVLTVPLNLANEYNGYATTSEWTFVATDNQVTKPVDPPVKPIVTPDPKPGQPIKVVTTINNSNNGSTVLGKLPQTDEANTLWSVLAGIVTLALVAIFSKRQKKN